jgi:hypothetical protein
LLPFFYFLFFDSGAEFSNESRILLFRSWGLVQGFQILGLDKKSKIKGYAFYPEPKFETLAALFDF